MKQESPVKLESLQSCLNGLSQDSGLGSSQEFPTLQLDKIVVPHHLTSSSTTGNVLDSDSTSRKRQHSESSLSEFEECKKPKLDKKTKVSRASTSKSPSNSISGSASTVCPDSINTPSDTIPIIPENGKNENDCLLVQNILKKTSDGQEVKESLSENVTQPYDSIPENKELCIMCNINPKNSIFLHGNIAHMCSCYKCAMRTWGTNKRCPVCNCKVRNVVKVFTI